jgi:hypothetical protein
LKIHQLFALVDVDYTEVFAFEKVSSPILESFLHSHYMAIAAQLKLHSGLNYVPRERNADGRVFEHASDCRVLIDHFASTSASQQSASQQQSYHRKDGLRSQMAGKTEMKPTKMDHIKDLNMGHFFIKLQSAEANEDEIN